MKSFSNRLETAAPMSDRLESTATGTTSSHSSPFGARLGAGVMLSLAFFAATAGAQTTIEGSVEAARRYRGLPATAGDVVLADTRIQDVLQSDTFDRLARHGRTRQALSDPGVRAALSADADAGYVVKPIDKLSPKLAGALFQGSLSANLRIWTTAREAETKASNIASGIHKARAGGFASPNSSKSN
jgi:hypothetical protein